MCIHSREKTLSQFFTRKQRWRRAICGQESDGAGKHKAVGIWQFEDVQTVIVAPEVSHLGWGHWYTIIELEEATNGFADENAIGEGGHGYTVVSWWPTLGGQAEMEFKVEFEAVGCVRHKNLMRLLVYCAEGAYRFTYMHEGLEPKVVDRDIKSSNILLDRQWNSKTSDFVLAKLLG